jgi:hypothetical protein
METLKLGAGTGVFPSVRCSCVALRVAVCVARNGRSFCVARCTLHPSIEDATATRRRNRVDIVGNRVEGNCSTKHNLYNSATFIFKVAARWQHVAPAALATTTFHLKVVEVVAA